MNGKRIIFPPTGNPGGGVSDGAPDERDGRNGSGSEDIFPDGAGASLPRGNMKSKGHAAYAAREPEAQPQSSRGGFGPIGGLFADDAAAPTGHGVQANAGGGNLLSVIAKDALLAECKTRICPDCDVKKEADEVRLRAMAELDNTRKRLAREKEEQIRYAAEAVLMEIIPSLDNLDLALQHSGNDPACNNFVIGVRMTRKLLMDALAKHGLTEVGAVGEEFDPALHEAVGTTDSPDVPQGHVSALLASGYRLKDRLLRPAKVMVCKK